MAVATAVACGGGAGGGPPLPAADSTADSAVAGVVAGPQAADSGMAQQVAALAASTAPASPTAFSHARHRGLDCRRCHAHVVGHESHASEACTDCHAPPPATTAAATPSECGSCHHASAQGRACTSCHQPQQRGALPLTVSWSFSVWPAPRTRDLEFDHRWHSGLACSSCHGDAPSFSARPDCGSCHAHHAGRADCRLCHQSPPPGAHTAEVHSGCAGSGCHRAPPVASATVSRAECLLCHPDRVDHQPGQDCARCHMPDAAVKRGEP